VGPCPFTLQRSKNKQNSLPPKISVYHVLGEKSNNIKFDCIKLIMLIYQLHIFRLITLYILMSNIFRYLHMNTIFLEI
jgi:hypothetical protein